MIYFTVAAYDPTRAEFNYYEYFILLFDKDLNIVEVRKLKGKHTKSEYYDSILIDGLKQSNSHWHKIVNGKHWYIYIVGYRIF
jgi:hypothetical protein